VLYASIHESGSFPGTGQVHDAGSGPGEGYTINLPVPSHSDGELWLSLLEHVILPAAKSFEPQLVLISAGYDAHDGDPLADCRLQTSAFAEMARQVRSFADVTETPVGAVLEGGYQPAVLAECVSETILALGDHKPASHVSAESILASGVGERAACYWPAVSARA
jgi:acetoin utilization deacetylase AcuC-like enzyme